MIKKIICPSDFSAAANNALEYAARIAKKTGAKLLLIHVESIPVVASAVSMGEGIGATERVSTRDALRQLKEQSLVVKQTFKIDVAYEVEVGTQSLERVLAEFGSAHTLIVMGTNGADSIYDYFFGTTAWHFASRVNCPVLVVPVAVSCKPTFRILYACDWETETVLSKKAVYDLLETFDPSVVILLESEKGIKSLIKTRSTQYKNLKFEHVISEDIPESIPAQMKKTRSDMLVLTNKHKGFLASLFQTESAEEFSETASFPVLLLPA